MSIAFYAALQRSITLVSAVGLQKRFEGIFLKPIRGRPELRHMGSCQNRGPCLGILNNRCRYYIRDPKRDHNFDNHSSDFAQGICMF